MLVVLWIVALLLYGALLTRAIPERLHIVANILASILAIVMATVQGINIDELGMSISSLLPGLLLAVAVSVFVMIAVGLFVLLLPKKYRERLPTVIRTGKVSYETAVRIPWSTALSEEILFRGVLLAVLIESMTVLPAVIICSLVFGIWHLLPSFRDHSVGAAIPIVAFTALAGVGFCVLRLVSGSIIAPWIVHWTINASALLAVDFIKKQRMT